MQPSHEDLNAIAERMGKDQDSKKLQVSFPFVDTRKAHQIAFALRRMFVMAEIPYISISVDEDLGVGGKGSQVIVKLPDLREHMRLLRTNKTKPKEGK